VEGASPAAFAALLSSGLDHRQIPELRWAASKHSHAPHPQNEEKAQGFASAAGPAAAARSARAGEEQHEDAAQDERPRAGSLLARGGPAVDEASARPEAPALESYLHVERAASASEPAFKDLFAHAGIRIWLTT
jgi:hypothetical protein